jgi:hypothetical protein
MNKSITLIMNKSFIQITCIESIIQISKEHVHPYMHDFVYETKHSVYVSEGLLLRHWSVTLMGWRKCQMISWTSSCAYKAR